ncbi:hypothetical protein [Capnocytophaga leadbetteri]|uniref:hypothetical protein n=1 Tax=Capnocytophaga leadbetteri TaxID=327575 RepID=UPI0028ED7A4F|nr:hypothetical protein [Capnocytophaga leadbetteri]
MKQLIIFILIIPLLGMVPPDKKKQRKVVEHYVATLLNTKDENIKDVFSLMKITEGHDKEKMDDLADFLLELKKQLKGQKYKILSYCEAYKGITETWGDPVPSERGDVYYIYNIKEGAVLYFAPVIVNRNNEIICIVMGFTDRQELCFIYL